MALSGREILLVLRARDEASRTLHRVSRSMGRLDRDAAAASSQMITTQQQHLTALSRSVGDVGNAYRLAAGQAHELHRVQQATTGRQLAEIRRQVDGVHQGYRDTVTQAQMLRGTNAITAREYDRQLQSARKLKNQQLDALRAERYAVEDVRRANIETYRASMAQAQGVRNSQLETIRQQKIQAQDAVRYHRENIEQLEEQRQALRQRGYALMDNGAAVATVGTGMTLFGLLSARAMGGAVQDAMDYTTQVRRTKTQVDEVNASLKTIHKIGLEVARDVPVAFEDIQPALYDIFSSIDTSVKGSRTLLKQFAKDAVGGQATLETATRANLQIMNAYKIETKDAAKVSDFMFQLVRKGVGTYDEFAKTIGRAIPSAVRAGQSYKTLGAMMAFMTRNGVSAAMAATSSARALDAISHPKTVSNLAKIGINVKNARGEFKPLPQILNAMNREFGNMTSPQRAKALQELFKGSGGTIQARRFFDSYFKNAKEFNQRSREMAASAGAAEDAFNTMAESPQAKLQALKNQWEILKVELGNNLLPIVLTILDAFNDLVDAFNKLPGPVKKGIAIFAALSAVVMTVMGVLTILAGGFMMIAGAAAAIGISAGALLGIFAGIALAIGALITVGYLVYKNWDRLAPLFARVKDSIMKNLGAAKDWVMKTFGPGIRSAIKMVKRAWEDFTWAAKKAWEDFKKAINWEKIKREFEEMEAKFRNLKGSIEGAAPGINGALKVIGLAFSTNLRAIGLALRIFGSVLGGVLGGAIRGIMSFVGDIASAMGDVIRAITSAVKAVRAVFRGDWSNAWSHAVQVAANMSRAIYKVMLAPFKAALKFNESIIRGILAAWRTLSNTLVGHSIVPDMVNAIVKWFRGLPGKIVSAIAGMPGRVISTFNRMRSDAVAKVTGLVDTAVTRLKALPGRAASALAGLPGKVAAKATEAVTRFKAPFNSLPGIMATVGRNIMSGLIGGIGSLMGDLAAKAASIASIVAGVVKNRMKMKSPSKVMKGIGQDIVRGLVQGIDDGIPSIKGIMKRVADQIDASKEGGKEREKRATAWIKKAAAADVRRLADVAGRLKTVRAELAKQKEALENLRNEAQNYREGIKESVISFGSMGSFEKFQETRSVTDAEGNVSEETVDLAWTPATVMQRMRQKLGQIRQFKNALEKMRQMGFNKYVIDQILQMGPDGGLELAEALLAAGPAAVNEMNEMTNLIRDNANQIADAAKADMYGAGLAAMEGLVAGLESQEAKLIETAQRIGAIIGKKIRQALKMKSPSKVMMDIGHNVGGSLAAAIASEEAAVARASTVLSNAAGRVAPVVGANGGGVGGPSKSVHQEITIHTNEIDPRANAAKLGWELANRV